MATTTRPPWPRFFLWLLPLSFALQVAAIGLLHQYRVRAGNDNFEFGWEMGRVARSLAQGHGFRSPYEGNTGPSAYEPPPYPLLMAGVFKLFGIYTQASAWALLTINSLLATLTTIPIFLIARKTFGERVALWSAYAWALSPYVWYWSIHWLWDTTLTPFILACIFLLALVLSNTAPEMSGVNGSGVNGSGVNGSRVNGSRVNGSRVNGSRVNGMPHVSPVLRDVGAHGRESNWRLWALFGMLYAVGALANPTMLAFLPFCGLWIWRQRYRQGLPSLAGIALASVVFFAVLTPWVVRNYEVFGRFVFLRDDFGPQLRLGNGPYADGMLMAYLQPNLNKLELEKFQRMGELAYADECKRLAFDWIRQHPTRFAVISLKRFFYYWNGVPRATGSQASVDFRTSGFLATSALALWGLGRALRQKRPAAWLFAGLVAFYPAIYYFVYPHARYRHPIEPELTILVVFLILEAVEKKIVE